MLIIQRQIIYITCTSYIYILRFYLFKRFNNNDLFMKLKKRLIYDNICNGITGSMYFIRIDE